MSNESDADVKKQVAGSLKEAIGRITGDNKIQAEGVSEKKTGQAQAIKSAKTGNKAN